MRTRRVSTPENRVASRFEPAMWMRTPSGVRVSSTWVRAASPRNRKNEIGDLDHHRVEGRAGGKARRQQDRENPDQEQEKEREAADRGAAAAQQRDGLVELAADPPRSAARLPALAIHGGPAGRPASPG